MFSPEARWDRPLLQQARLPGEPVDVVASFVRGRMAPCRFRFSGIDHQIRRIEMQWQARNGTDQWHAFSVTDTQQRLYTLWFSREKLVWRVVIRDG